jgi:hypothetical protein
MTYFRGMSENSFMACFGKKLGESQKDFPASAAFSNAKVLYFGIAYPEPHHNKYYLSFCLLDT